MRAAQTRTVSDHPRERSDEHDEDGSELEQRRDELRPGEHPDRDKAQAAGGRKASAFFKRKDVQAYIEKRRAEIQVSSGVTFEYLVAQQRRVLERCMQIAPVKDSRGDETGAFQFNATGANRAVETLAKLIGAFEADNKQKGEAAADAFGEMMERIAGGSHKPGDF